MCKNELFRKKHTKISHKPKIRGFVFFQVGQTGLKSPMLQFEKKKCTQTRNFLQKFDFCIFEPKNCEVIENSFKAPLDFSPLKCTYSGKNSFQ